MKTKENTVNMKKKTVCFKLRAIPADVHLKLKIKAAKNGESIENHILDLIVKDVNRE